MTINNKWSKPNNWWWLRILRILRIQKIQRTLLRATQHNDSDDMASRNIGQVEPFGVVEHNWILYIGWVQEYIVAKWINAEEKRHAVSVTLMNSEAYNLLASLIAALDKEVRRYYHLLFETKILSYHWEAQILQEKPERRRKNCSISSRPKAISRKM